LNGGDSTIADASLDHIPLYVPAGSILPMGPREQYTTEKPADLIELRIYPGADATFTLYEDEGTNYNYEKGQYSTITLRWDDRSSELEIGQRTGSFPHMLSQRSFSIHLAGSAAVPKLVAYQGSAIRLSIK
jgi:alpha-D-xyloside xylohydrolase